MKARYTLIMASFALITTIITYFGSKYFRWKAKSPKCLQANSSMMDTAAGLVEYTQGGTGPVLLFIHGSPGGYDHSKALADMFGSDQFTYIAVSRPGYLRTPLEQKSPEAQADLYAALLDKLGITKTTIIGISGGGPSALQFALRHPERCSGLILLCAVSQRYSEQEVREALPPVRRFFSLFLERFVYSNSFAIFSAEEILRLLPYTIVPEGIIHSLIMPRLRDAGYKNDMEQFEQISDYPLEKITTPTFILHGDRDLDVPLKDSILAASKIPHARFVIDKGGTHIFFIIHRQKIVPLLLDFLTQTEKDATLDKH